MATLDGTQVFESVPTSGAAFLLTKPVKEAFSLAAPEGWAAEARHRYVVIRKPVTLAGYAATLETAFAAAQQSLDLASMLRIGHFGIRDAEAEHLVWWPEGTEQVLRVVFNTAFTIGISASGSVSDSSGRVISPSPLPPTVWHESGRYFRLSQATDDLFDSFRNLYLALEAILDHITPQLSNEKEGRWFRRALTDAHMRIDLSRFATPGTADPVSEIYRQLYTDTRNLLFHAKGSRPRYVPQGAASEKEAVTHAVRNMSQLYLALASQEFNLRHGGARFAPSVFNGIRQAFKPKLRLHVTDDRAPADPDQTAINPSGGVVVDLATAHAPEFDAPFTCVFIGSVCNPTSKIKEITRLGSTLDEKPAMFGDLEGVLTLEGVDRFEGHLGMRMRSAGSPKEQFPM